MRMSTSSTPRLVDSSTNQGLLLDDGRPGGSRWQGGLGAQQHRQDEGWLTLNVVAVALCYC